MAQRETQNLTFDFASPVLKQEVSYARLFMIQRHLLLGCRDSSV